ncbi:MAG: ROK family protein [Gemmatimonadales bacterium]|jgi:glucokinase
MAGSGDVTIGIDLGGTKVEVALVDGRGTVLGGGRRPTSAERGPDGVLADLVGLAKDCLASAERRVLGVGVGVAGQIDPETGTVVQAPNLAWSDFPLKARLERAIDLPVFVINDVQAATYGEWMCGAGRGAQDLVCLFVGTGVGGGVVSGGSLMRGCGGTAGELGHMMLDWHGPPCTCGNRGCLEAFAAGWAIARRAREAAEDPAEEGGTLIDLADGGADNLTAEVVARAAHDGDPLAVRLMRETGEALGVGVASIANAFNPCKVILGGGVIEGMPELVALAETEARGRALEAALHPLEIVRAGLGKHAGTVGAAMWARRGLAAVGSGAD